MPIFQKPSLKSGTQKREMPEGLWQKCPECGEVIHNLEVSNDLKVCQKCDHHVTLSAAERIHNLLDPDCLEEFDANLTSKDVLKFTGVAAYSDRLSSYQEKTGMKDAVVTGFGKIEKKPIAIAVMDFNFLAATMGSVVGEKITRVIEKATATKRPLIIVAASGGARMYEGMLSLMQMAKTSGALARHAEADLPYISVLTHPTTAGVIASFTGSPRKSAAIVEVRSCRRDQWQRFGVRDAGIDLSRRRIKDRALHLAAFSPLQRANSSKPALYPR